MPPEFAQQLQDILGQIMEGMQQMSQVVQQTQQDQQELVAAISALKQEHQAMVQQLNQPAPYEGVQ